MTNDEEDPRIRLLLQEAARRSDAEEYPHTRRGRRVLLVFGLPVWLIVVPAIFWGGGGVTAALLTAIFPLLVAAAVTYRIK